MKTANEPTMSIVLCILELLRPWQRFVKKEKEIKKFFAIIKILHMNSIAFNHR